MKPHRHANSSDADVRAPLVTALQALRALAAYRVGRRCWSQINASRWAIGTAIGIAIGILLLVCLILLCFLLKTIFFYMFLYVFS